MFKTTKLEFSKNVFTYVKYVIAKYNFLSEVYPYMRLYVNLLFERVLN